MASPYIGEIRIFAGNYAPQGWAMCNGQLVNISDNDALFNLIGTTYGGDGVNTFGLPDLRGRAPVHIGQGTGLSQYTLGQNGGVETVALTATQMPVHSHPVIANPATGTQTTPAGNVLAGGAAVERYEAGTPTQALYGGTLSITGGSQPHSNLQPYQCVTFIIALTGIYPSQG